MGYPNCFPCYFISLSSKAPSISVTLNTLLALSHKLIHDFMSCHSYITGFRGQSDFVASLARRQLRFGDLYLEGALTSNITTLLVTHWHHFQCDQAETSLYKGGTLVFTYRGLPTVFWMHAWASPNIMTSLLGDAHTRTNITASVCL